MGMILHTCRPKTGAITVSKAVVQSGVDIKFISNGALYNWFAGAKNGGSGVGSIAPIGYHIPSRPELQTLLNFVGANATYKLMEANLLYWGNITNFTNNYLFNGRGAGIRYGALFYLQKQYCDLMTITQGMYGVSSYDHLLLDGAMAAPFFKSDNNNKGEYGCSIRPLKDTAELSETGIVTDIDGNIYHEVLIGSQVWLQENLSVTHYNDGTPIQNVTGSWVSLPTDAYCWFDNDINNAFTTIPGTPVPAPDDLTWFHVTLTEQGVDEPFVFEGDFNQGEPAKFKGVPFGTYKVEETAVDGYTSGTVEDIVLTKGARNQWVTVVNEAIPVEPTLINYGALYNGYTALKNGGSGVGSIAPIGYHVASQADYEILFNSIDTDDGGYWPIAGTNLKEAGFSHWINNESSIEGTNDYGFGIRGSGFRMRGTGEFMYLKSYCFINTSDTYDVDAELGISVISCQYNDSGIATNRNLINDGASIRALKNTSEWFDGETVTDIDGNVYSTVKIGDQVWIKEHLAVTNFNDGTPIPNITDNTEWAALTTPGYCWYNNDITNK